VETKRWRPAVESEKVVWRVGSYVPFLEIEITMDTLEMKLGAGPTPTSVSVHVRNLSSRPMNVFAPDPYKSAWISDSNGESYARIRAVKWEHSPKVALIRPNESIVATIDLLHFFDEVSGKVWVRIKLEATDDSGVPQEHFVEGSIPLRIPSYEDRIAEWKRNPGPRGVPMRIFDVSNCTQFTRPT
jgi:hypothetical protein